MNSDSKTFDALWLSKYKIDHVLKKLLNIILF